MPKSAKNNKPVKKTSRRGGAFEVIGKFIGHAKGHGFVDDVFIPPSNIGGALFGDEVKVQVNSKGEGKVVEVLRRMPQVGTFHSAAGFMYLQPISRKIPQSFSLSKKVADKLGLQQGQRVVFTSDGERVHVHEILGFEGEPGMDVLSLIKAAGVPYEFPSALLAEHWPEKVSCVENRRDLRDCEIFTIDGADTKDIDDAISISRTENGYRLGVHIADVAHYVTASCATDTEAKLRGTSIYLADRTIPMLPHALSSGICSLFAGVDRLTMTCEMEVDREGEVVSYEIYESVICSRKQWTYDEVDEILMGALPPSPREGTCPLDPFHLLDELRAVLFAKRVARGALDLDVPEAKIVVDAEGRPTDIGVRRRTRATGIIEECMILANECVAQHFLKRKKPSVFRFHDQAAPGSNIKTLLRQLASARGTAGEYAISMSILQALPRAVYHEKHATHYGLASAGYLHFTSPIRRYADLTVHRLLKGEKVKNLPEIAAHCSKAERVAEQLERDVADLKKVQYMVGREGESFDATVSSVQKWGVYVMLLSDRSEARKCSRDSLPAERRGDGGSTPIPIEGLIPANTLRRHHGLLPGMKVQVTLVSANETDRRLNFSL